MEPGHTTDNILQKLWEIIEITSYASALLAFVTICRLIHIAHV